MEPLKIAENKRYFVKGEKPFTWIADTDWTMPQRMKWDDVEWFMKKRKQQGFTVLQIVALDPEQDVYMRTPAGEPALHQQNLDTPNEIYFSYLDKILNLAEQMGFYVLLLPVWGQLVVGDNWMGETFDKVVTKENAYGYGKWIGERYREKTNLLWCLGGDRQPIHKGTDYRNVWRRMAEGLAKGVLGKDLVYNENRQEWSKLLLTYHACHEAETGECSTMSYWTDEEAWIQFIMLQSGHGTKPKNYELVKKEYERENTMPVWDGEPAYEMMPTTWPVTDNQFHGSHMVRKRAYSSLFAGAFGYTYGHGSVWCMISEKEKNEIARYDWFEATMAKGATQIRYLRDFLESKDILNCIPCQQILSEKHEKKEQDVKEHVQACFHKEKQFACIYFPKGMTEEIDLTKLPKEQQMSEYYSVWFNPRDGKIYEDNGHLAGKEQLTLHREQKFVITTPTNGEEEDYVLILAVSKEECEILQREYKEEQRTAVKKVFQW